MEQSVATPTSSSNLQAATTPAPQSDKLAKSNAKIARLTAFQTRKESGLVSQKPVENKDGVIDDGVSKPAQKQQESSSVKDGEKPSVSEVSKPDETKKVTAEKKPEDTKPLPKADTIEWWKAESAKHQSRADTLEERTKKEVAELTTIKQERDQYKQLVDRFEQNPAEVLQEYLPQIQEKMALQSGDQISFVEKKVEQAKKQIDTEFAKQLGENWRFNEYESLQPGTPSFRYKLALENAKDTAKTEILGYIQKQRAQVEVLKKQKEQDIQDLRNEYGFTDEDLNAVEDFASKNNLSYKMIAKIALFDKIVQNKINQLKVLNPERANKDISSSPGASSKLEQKIELSPQSRKNLSRLGASGFRK